MGTFVPIDIGATKDGGRLLRGDKRRLTPLAIRFGPLRGSANEL